MSWLWAALWVVVIYITIPLAPALRTYVDEQVGRIWFAYLVIALVLVCGLISAAKLFKGIRGIEWKSIVLLVLIAAVYIVWTLHLAKESAEEAIHFLQYGVLALLLFRAFSHRVRDVSIYAAIAITGGIVGTIDEIIQWMVPERYFDFRDIRLNIASCLLMIVAIQFCFRPVYIVGKIVPRSYLRLLGLGTIFWLLIFFCRVNSPALQAFYTKLLPAFSGILEHGEVMTEFGYRYVNPDIGSFKSRLYPEELEKQDRERAVEAGKVLDEYHSPARYKEFCNEYTSKKDAFLHEARVHLFRRDRHRHNLAAPEEDDRITALEHATIAYRENLIMERYFSHTLSNTMFRLRRDTVSFLREAQDPDFPYESKVSNHVVTRLTVQEVISRMLGIGAAWILICGGLYFGSTRGRRTETGDSPDPEDSSE
jgi:VanZ family protein